METNESQPDRQYDEIEQLIAEIVADPEVRKEMSKIQPIDVLLTFPTLAVNLGIWNIPKDSESLLSPLQRECKIYTQLRIG